MMLSYYNMYKRLLTMPLSSRQTCFLWGPRQTGKSTLLKHLFPGATLYDLLRADVYERLVRNPSLIREECDAAQLSGATQTDPIIIDEFQKVPALLDEVHWLMEDRGVRFILCGSSARKIKRGQANLLGGRGIRYELYPLTYREIPDFSLRAAINNGLLPAHYASDISTRQLQAYVGDYLREEIAAEAITRNIGAFSRFLEIAAMSNGELINFTNIASECGVGAATVKGYFQILEDTLIGRQIHPYRKRVKRRLVGMPKFYFFDVGIVSYLAHRGLVELRSELFGKAFEHFLFMELTAHSSYSERFYPVSFWRSTSGFEVDFILGDCDVAIEVKSSGLVRDQHLRGIRAFKEEHSAKRYMVVSLDPEPRRTKDGIDILPWNVFLDRLWKGKVLR